MAKADLGEKRVCAECAVKFFDLKKRPVVCPKCGFSFDPDVMARRSARKATPDAKAEANEDEEIAPDAADAEDESEIEEIDQQELSLDDAAPILVGSDDDTDSDTASSNTSLPDGYSEEGVDDDSEILTDDEDEDAKLVDEEELDSEA